MACIYTEHTDAPIIEIRVVGRVTEHDMDEILPKMEAFIGKHGTIRMIEIIEKFEGFDPTTVLDGMKFDMKHMKDISHAAVVSDMPWVAIMTNAAAMVMPVTVRVFTLGQIDDAREWIAGAD